MSELTELTDQLRVTELLRHSSNTLFSQQEGHTAHLIPSKSGVRVASDGKKLPIRTQSAVIKAGRSWNTLEE